jgi:hypothetical protein
MIDRDRRNTQFAVLQTGQGLWQTNGTTWSTMRFESLEKSQEALDNALRDLETTRMTPSDDPKLAKLKADIRRAIDKRRPEKRKSGKASRQK